MSTDSVVSDRNLWLNNVVRKAGMVESVPQDGGDLVGIDIATQIVDKLFSESSYVHDVVRFPLRPNTNAIKVPYTINPLQSAPASGARAYWTGEAADLTASAAALGYALLTLKKTTVLVPSTMELIEDVSNLSEHVIDQAAKAAQRLIASEMLFGTGSIKGVFTTTTATLSTAISATPSAAQLNTAFNLLHPTLIPGAKWFVTQTVYTALFNSGYNNVDKTFGKLTVLGLPVEVCPYLLAANKHVLLGNFGAYGIGYRDPRHTIHDVYALLSDQIYFRLCMRIAGDVITLTSPTDDNTTRGAFVIPA